MYMGSVPEPTNCFNNYLEAGLTEALYSFLTCILCFVATVLWKQESFCSLGTEDPPFSATQVYDFFIVFLNLSFQLFIIFGPT